jgi:PAS domain S-box-containing protein
MLSSDLARGALDSSPDAMIIIDSSGAIVFANHQVSALFGYQAHEIEGQRVEVLLTERFRAHHVTHRQNYAANVRVRPMGNGLDLFARRNDGSEFPVEISLSPMSGTETLTAASIRDVTDRRAIQTELKASSRDSRSRESGKEPIPGNGKS